jgi:diguanylate cyclase (GGDEF)-like protein
MALNQNKIGTHHVPRPNHDALRIIVVYLIIGGLWILLSDTLLEALVDDPARVSELQLYKGWFYVVVTAGVFFLIIRHRIQLYKTTHESIRSTNRSLDQSNRELLRMEGELTMLAYFDSLTGLANRSKLEEAVTRFITINGKEAMPFALVYFDIDQFKHINETIGHNVGDQLLIALAEELAEDVHTPNMISRLSGDDFAIVMFDALSETEAVHRSELLLSKVRRNWQLASQEFFVTLSVGIAMYPSHGLTFSELLQNADAAVDVAKDGGRDRIAVYSDAMRQKTMHHLELTTMLRGAILNRQFQLFYQPIIRLSDHKILGFEALIRWFHPERGLIYPGDFIAFAERTSLITPIEEWVFREAFRQAKAWGFESRDMHISINLSAVTLLRDDFVFSVAQMLEQEQAQATWFQIEVTETAVMTDMSRAIDVLHELKKLGFAISLDDFGSGYSSLTHLRTLPIDILKIDRSFIPIEEEETDKSQILKSMIRLAHFLRLEVVAEGIETQRQSELVNRMDCDSAQGYLYGRPVSVAECERVGYLTGV